RPETSLVSVGYVNSEIGVIQPIGKISKLLKSYKLHVTHYKNEKLIFHVDASQAPPYLNCEKETLGANLITVDGHKIYGPLGIGALFVRRGIKLKPLMFGGGQESGLRPGTENLPAIVGLTEALELAKKNREKESVRLTILRDFFIAQIEKEIPKVILNGSRIERLPNNINFSFPGTEAEFLALQLDATGIAVATKSACLKNERESYVIKALGGDPLRATSAIRFSFGKDTKKSDLEYTIKVLCALF
ncbi:MAG: aminotransferase class V-fold PLP-dependent enzyme, partial [Patescibacteria group bacterium]